MRTILFFSPLIAITFNSAMDSDVRNLFKMQERKLISRWTKRRRWSGGLHIQHAVPLPLGSFWFFSLVRPSLSPTFPTPAAMQSLKLCAQSRLLLNMHGCLTFKGRDSIVGGLIKAEWGGGIFIEMHQLH